MLRTASGSKPTLGFSTAAGAGVRSERRGLKSNWFMALGQRLMRYKTSRYFPDEQRAEVHFMYDRFRHGKAAKRRVSDFEAHVYFPRELNLLFRHTGFVVEAVYGDPRFGPLCGTSLQMIVIGRKPMTSA